jgi:hypothetical protein
MFAGVAAYNGYGDPTDPDRAERIAQSITDGFYKVRALMGIAEARGVSWPRERHLILQRHVGHVLRTALVKPAMNRPANTHAKTRNTQPTAVS